MASFIHSFTRPGWPLLIACFAGAGLLWASMPPLEWGVLVWAGLVPWFWAALVLVRESPRAAPGENKPRRSRPEENSPGEAALARPRWFLRPLGAAWLSAWGFWLAVLYWLLPPHWAGVFGWLALTLYLSLYTWALVWLSAWMVRRWHVPLPLAAGVVWAAGAVVRARLFGGFTIASPAYALYQQLPAIQLAELAGQHGVDLWVVLVSAAAASALWHAFAERRLRPALLAAGTGAAVLLAGWGYGHWRLRQLPPPTAPALKAILVQSSFDTVFGQSRQRILQMHQQCVELTAQAVAQHPEARLVLWPETMFHPTLEFLKRYPELVSPLFLDQLARVHAVAGQRWLVLGVHAAQYEDVPPPPGARPQRFNTAVLVSPRGKLVARYHKMKPIIFGEYIPLGDFFPWLYRLAPMDQGLAPGPAPAVFPLENTSLVPNICYESILPHLVRRQVNHAAAEAVRENLPRPEVLVNLTNSGWFWGSSELKLHLISHVFRAVETRRPVLVAANTGISAAVDHRGQILAQAPRRQATFLFVQVRPYAADTFYLAWGDTWAWLCMGAVAAALAFMAWERFFAKGRP